MIGEIWKIVPSAPQLLVSSEGRVMVAPYMASMPNGGVRQYGGEPHFGVWSKEDARFIVVYKGKTYKVHQLVCEGFHGPRPHADSICIHGDENSANNRPSNLKWGTQKENLAAPGFREYCRNRTGDDSPWIKGRISLSLAQATQT
ncbi:HNH endonuclease signature motif containing protein [Ciceribacter ferrooxidans]|uniref:HNH endonuclease n=1 Tax=Ciceribacter ferrooxidans TaxID=2509717 RepID=A0A4V1RPQ1_9HYPH|nr:HNH endonuclease signature motif containing protein [Ciceribacter ferrooxidans]RYC10137.1 HNH endonuclease [Ciceribacter ferrooxidans]